MRLGRETFDVPCVPDHKFNPEAQEDLEKDAKNWLMRELDGYATVRKVYNDHDFGPYPSFEIDETWEYEEALEDDESEELNINGRPLYEVAEEWWNKINEVSAKYGEQFSEEL